MPACHRTPVPHILTVGLILLILAVPIGAEECCIGTRGDIYLEPDCDIANPGTDVGDLTNLIDHLFINYTPLCCVAEADLAPFSRPDGIVDVADLTDLIAYLFITFPPMPPCENVLPSGELTDRSACKNLGMAKLDSIDLDHSTCLVYEYDGVSVLTVRHVNAQLNCCPVLAPVIIVDDSTIIIDEIETEGLCDCICLFDLDYLITNLPPGMYRLVLREQYLLEQYAPLDFQIDLTTPVSDTLCQPRPYYYP